MHTEDGTQRGGDEEQGRIVGEEERVLARVQKNLANRRLRAPTEGLDYDAELISLRDQIQEARLEDVPPLIEEMERLSEVAARRAKVTEGAVDPDSPYFGRLVLEENERRREVLIGRSTYLDNRTGVRIVDWRDAPVSRIYYRYEEGDVYEENFGGRDVHGEVVTRRSLAISSGNLRRIGCPQGVFVRAADGTWRRAGESASRLKGGQGAAMRPEGHHSPAEGRRGKLGTGIEGREDRFLPEITALIDPRQFDLITRSDAGLVVIQGGAGSGKTTIGLHRLAYLAYQDPKRFRPDRMLVIVFNDALVRYISRVLPALGAPGVPVTTFERFAQKLRAGHLRGLPDIYSEQTPGAVTRLKKHPTMLRVIDELVARTAKKLESWLEESLGRVEPQDAREVLAFFRDQERAPLAVRLMRLQQWVAPEVKPDEEIDPDERGPQRSTAPRPLAVRHAVERVVARARRELLDVSAAWAEMLTDRETLREAFERHSPGALDEDDLRTAHHWCTDRCGAVMGELEARREDGERTRDEKSDRDKERGSGRTPGAPPPGPGRTPPPGPGERAIDEEVLPERAPAQRLVARRKTDEDDDGDEDDDDRSLGIDGAMEHEPPNLDREDDALLLRLVQRLRGPLVRGKERLRYEHILIDEAQDLSPVELAVVMGCASKARSVTMAGDVAQRLHMDNGFTGWSDLLQAIRPHSRADERADAEAIAVEPLKVQYRSTHEIITFAQDVLGPLADPTGGHAIRGGAPVELFQFTHNGEAVAFLGEALRELMQAEPRASIALIARYPEQADVYYRGLVNAEVPHLRRIAEQDFPFKPGIDVTDVRQVKGLEFDYVVLLEVSRASYPVNDESRHLLHIAATRAAHQLWVTTSGEPSLLLPEPLRSRAH